MLMKKFYFMFGQCQIVYSEILSDSAVTEEQKSCGCQITHKKRTKSFSFIFFYVKLVS